MKVLLLILLPISLLAQQFDPVYEKSVRSEINLSRIHKSYNPLDVISYKKQDADSLCAKYRIEWMRAQRGNSKDPVYDYTVMNNAVGEFMNKDPYVSYNVFATFATGIPTKLRGLTHPYFLQKNYTDMSISTIRDGDMIFVAIISW